jgi:hypothetical protein
MLSFRKTAQVLRIYTLRILLSRLATPPRRSSRLEARSLQAPAGHTVTPETFQVLDKRKNLGHAPEVFPFIYRLPPIRGPGFRLETMSLFEYFFGERVF